MRLSIPALLNSRDGFPRTEGTQERSTIQDKLLASTLVDAVTRTDEYPTKVIEGLETLLPELILTDSELSTLLHALYEWSNADTDLRLGLENDERFFAAFYLITNAGLHVKGVETSKLLILLARTMETSSEPDVIALALVLATNIATHNPRLRGNSPTAEVFRACLKVIEEAKSSKNVKLAIELLAVLPLQKHFSLYSDALAKILCATLTMEVNSSEGPKGDEQVRAVVSFCKKLLALPCRHYFFGSIAKIAKTPQKNATDAALVRGAVYLIGMALWSHQRIEAIAKETSLTSALSILRVATSSGEAHVITEVELSLRRLVKKYGPELDVEWDAVLDLFEDLIPHTGKCLTLKETALELAAFYLQTSVESLAADRSQRHDTQLPLDANYTYERIGNVLDKCRDMLPEEIALELMRARASSAQPWRGLVSYVDVLQKVMTLYYKEESRENIRVETLNTIRDALVTYQGLYDDTLVGDVLLPYIGQELVAETSPSTELELSLLFEVARDLPIADTRFSAILEHFDERARQGYSPAGEATSLLVQLLYSRMTRTPISRAVSVFKSLVGVHVHSPNEKSREIAIHAVSTISATSQYRIIAAGVHSYFLVSHLRSARKGDESTPIVLFPIQFAITNFAQRLKEECSEKLSSAVFESLEALLSNVFVMRDCKLEWLAAELLRDVRDDVLYAKTPNLRRQLLAVLHMLAGYNVEVEETVCVLQGELDAASRSISDTREILNYLFAHNCSKPLDGPAAEGILGAIHECLQADDVDELELLCILECLKNFSSLPADYKVASMGLKSVLTAIKRSSKVEEKNSARWRRLCLANFILWARVADPSAVVGLLSEHLNPLAAAGEILAIACVEYVGCFVHEDERTKLGVAWRRRPGQSQTGEGKEATFIVGLKPTQHLVSIYMRPDSPVEVVQRRPTGTSRFWVQSSNVPSTLKSNTVEGRHGGALSGDSRQQEEANLVSAGDSPRPKEQVPSEESGLLSLADLAIAKNKTHQPKLKKKRALRKAYQAMSTLTDAIGSASDVLQLSTASGTPRDPVRLLCQLGLGGKGAAPLPEEDELVPHALSMLDRLAAEDTHRIGLIYVGEDDGDEASILDNIAGSDAYLGFLRRLGSFIRLGKTSGNIFTGGLDSSGRDIDGEYCLHWADCATQVVFHVTTMMPNTDRSSGVLKKRHVGNDHVNVIWSEKGPDFDAKVVDSQFNSVHIVVSPGGQSQYRVRVRVNKPGIAPFGPLKPDRIEVVSEGALGPLVRATAINADVVCGDGLANWEQRAFQISKIGERVVRGDTCLPVTV
ncbi:hypothetical protein NDN08_000988 [Rhodosorus marinus]|uniref:Rap-GAP domain-containing protein n=1 Tax=Rhodosorus marinus TaxID=101924 RepID=A0AAV8USJ4_9RHOD|nr:hypothetical protein NDN08_000988 [Rhodosorus marinus]